MRSQRGKRFVGCGNFPRCRNSFPLPQRGRIEFAEVTCDLCGAPMLARYGRGRKTKPSCINMKCESHKKKEE
jgi:DNA topoisomerase-1